MILGSLKCIFVYVHKLPTETLAKNLKPLVNLWATLQATRWIDQNCTGPIWKTYHAQYTYIVPPCRAPQGSWVGLKWILSSFIVYIYIHNYRWVTNQITTPMAAHCKYVRSYHYVFSCCLVPNWTKMRNVTINKSFSFRSNQPPKRNSIAKPNKHEKTYWKLT